ncbi:hypothetical protein AKJ45_03705 [candidate division MSBL1 archaeon SCGC-AAA261F19]|uniref:PIN domain-containing protein n=1 Tax=candidate division MSBL1 archaeon SCGC-AAA261F19 TaxID=1698275 RepID=A0A133V6T5_9EURY|nr:hypothetical protein AKJ45_03705 [candidate division MSBL1 archaeon SCGC-AAA261F19]
MLRFEYQVARGLKEGFSLEEEAFAIVLARENDCRLATDDGQAIKVCKVFGLEFTTTIDFLIRAYQRNRLPRPIALEKLKSWKNMDITNHQLLNSQKIK